MSADHPPFAREFPREPELDTLVEAFVAGDYRRVRVGARALSARSEDPRVRDAAAELRARTSTDPLATGLLLLSLATLVALAAFWLNHDRPAPAPVKRPPVERID